MQAAPVQRITSVRAPLSLHSLTAQHLLLTSHRLVDQPAQGTQTGRSVANCEWTLPVHCSATSSFIVDHQSFRNRLRSLVKRIARSEQPRVPISWLFALRCLLVTATCSLPFWLAGCGPASSDNALSPESRASVGRPSLSKQSPSPGNNSSIPATQASSPVPLAPRNETVAASEKETVPGGGSPSAVSSPSTKPADTLAPLVVPAWMAKELTSPDVGTRIRALETWAQSAPAGSIDPLILAYEDKDERVRARAMELIEQDWARAADSAQSQ